MKVRNCLAAFFVLFLFLPAASAEEYGKIRAFKERTAVVTKQKNDFVARVLTSYAVPYERNAEGAVVRIHNEGQWLEVRAIEIVPVLNDKVGQDQQVRAHELLFHTPQGILALVSELAIR